MGYTRRTLKMLLKAKTNLDRRQQQDYIRKAKREFEQLELEPALMRQAYMALQELQAGLRAPNEF